MHLKTVLPNGVRIVSEQIPGSRSVAIGIWVGAGSRHELPEYEGSSHLIEHMLFKGTEKRSARQLAEALEKVGGQLNAFTAKEFTCYHARVLDEDFDLAVDVLQDMFFHSVFEEEGLKRERDVIVEEIKMYDDTPDELVHELFSRYAWDKHPLAHPILGNETTVREMKREDILNYMETRYTPQDVVIAVAGSISHEDLLTRLAVFGEFKRQREEITPPPPVLRGFNNIFSKDTEQAHIVMGAQGYPQEHDMTYPMHIVNSVLGAGLSSRLFQEIREQRGLAYSIYSYHTSYMDTGLFAIYAGTTPQKTSEVMDCVMQEMATLRQNGLSVQELADTKAQLKGSLYLGMESTSSRMNRLGKTELTLNRVKTVDETVEQLEKVTREDVRDLLDVLWLPEKISILVLGPKDSYKEGIPVLAPRRGA
ncbi:MAG: insulinase family protein [Peptococcaceae bacterium]|nr:insulinase family protein [Peptococcaceae bacterium]